MKIKSPWTFVSIVLLALASSHLHAAVKMTSKGIIFSGGTGEVSGLPLLHLPSQFPEIYFQGWLTPGSGAANFVAPVGQFTGYDETGFPIDYADLIPLMTSSVTVVDAEGNAISSSGPDGNFFSGSSLFAGSVDVEGVITCAPGGDIPMYTGN